MSRPCGAMRRSFLQRHMCQHGINPASRLRSRDPLEHHDQHSGPCDGTLANCVAFSNASSPGYLQMSSIPHGVEDDLCIREYVPDQSPFLMSAEAIPPVC